MTKKIIITADDFGISQKTNQAILKGFNDGLLTSTCIMANGEAFEHALQEILPDCPNIGLGIHLNIIEGKTVRPIHRDSLLCDNQGNYDNGFVQLLARSTNKAFLNEVETDFRIQIEKILAKTTVCHLNSHVHTHAIPNIFQITCKLAEEYGIKYIRTQKEIPYFIPSLQKHLNLKYPINLIKLGLLNTFSKINKKTLKKYSVYSNDYFIGVTYTGYIDENAILYGIRAIKEENSITEIILHPTVDINKKSNYQEFLSITNSNLKNEFLASNWELTHHGRLLSDNKTF